MKRPTALSMMVVALMAAAPLAGCQKPVDVLERTAAAATAPQGSVKLVPPASDLPEAPAEIAGDLRPLQAANLSFKIGGRLSALRVSRGQHVKAGQVLATLSDAEARATLAQAEAAVQVARAQAALAEDSEQRVRHLGTAEVVSSSAVVAARLSADAARAMVTQALAAASLARANLSNHVLTAPFDGVIVNVPDGVGETVGPGIPLMRLEKLDVLLLRATASEADIASLSVGMMLIVRSNAGTEGQGRVRSVLASLEPVSRRAPVEIEVANPDGRFAAGAYVRARLPASADATRAEDSR